MTQTLTATNPRKEPIVTKAFLRAAEILQLSRTEASNLLGISPATMSRLHTKGGTITLDTNEGELALMFLRIFRSLDSLFGGNEHNMRQWFDAKNNYLNGTPRDLVQHIGGISHVAEYLDAMRGKV